MGATALILTLVFLVLKLAGVIAFSWWLVFLPLIVSGLIGIGVLLAAYSVARVLSR